MNQFLKGLVVLIIIGVIAQIIVYPKIGWFWDQDEESADTPAAFARPQSAPLEVTGVIMESSELINKIQVTGEIIPNESLDVRSEMPGKLDEIYFKEGQPVTKGALLARINVDDLRAQLEKLKYTQKLRATLETRQRQLLDREAISQEEYDQALTELQTAEADINVIETEINKSEIRAPFSGVMGLREKSAGAYITSSDVIAPLYSVHPAKIQFAIPGKYSARVATGNHISFTVEGINRTFDGRVYAIEPRVDPNTRTLLLRATCPNPGRVLLPGQFAQVELILEVKDSVIMVPTEAVIPEINGSKVFVLRSGKAMPSPVETGLRTATDLEITSGLIAGDTVLTSGILQIRPGMAVNVKL